MNDPEDRQPAGQHPGPSTEPPETPPAPAPGGPPAADTADVAPLSAPSYMPPDAPPLPPPPPPPIPSPVPMAAPPTVPLPAPPGPAAPPPVPPPAPEARWEDVVDPTVSLSTQAPSPPSPPPPPPPPPAPPASEPKLEAPVWPEPRAARPAPSAPSTSPPPVIAQDQEGEDDDDYDDDDELDESVSRWAALMATIGTALVGIVSVQVITSVVEGVALKKGQRVGIADDLFHRLGYPFGGLGATALVFLVLGVVLISLPSVLDEYLSESQDRMVGVALIVAVVMGVIIAIGSVLAVRANLHEYAAKGVAVPAYVRVQFTNFLLGSLGAAALALFGSIAAMNQRDRERSG